MDSIPVIDIGPAITGEGSVTEVVEQLRTAITEIGFLQVINHGIPASMVDDVHAALDRVATMPDAQRKALLRPRSESRGLFESIDSQGRVLGRGMQFVPYDDLSVAEAAGAVKGHPDYFPANVWPSEDPAFKETMVTYSAATRELSRILMGLFAQALELPADYFEAPFEHDVTLHSLNMYPSQPVDDPEHEEVILRAHPDSGVLAVLHQRGTYDGLQVQARDGSWVTVAIRDDAFVINIGELMSRWTNGTWPATIHRVVAGPTSDDRRASVAVFYLPSLDTVVAPLPSTIGDDGAKYDAIDVYGWQRKFMTDYVLEGRSYNEPVSV